MNRTLGEEYYDALEEAAMRKNDALRAKKSLERVYAEIYLRSTGTIEDRKQRTLVDPHYVSRDDAWVEAASAHNLAEARADGLQVRFEEWRTNEATLRAVTRP